MLVSLLQGALVKFGALAIQYLGVSLLSMFFDAIDEAVESVLEKEEKKAKETPEDVDDRRLALLRKYFEGWKVFSKK